MTASSHHSARDLFSYRKYWAKRYGIAPFLPMSRAEMDTLGWDSCDIIIVTGDAYVDHPSFGMAVIGRMLEAQGFRVGILAQPDWTSAADFMRLGRPNLFFGITGGNMDSMVNRYTSDRKIRSNDAYTPHGTAGKRPDRAVTVYSQRAREAYKDVPILIGGIEASLRRIAHYDYWSDTVRRSVLLDAKADLLVYGNAERQIVDIAHRLAAGEAITDITDVRGTTFVRRGGLPDGWAEIDSADIDMPGRIDRPVDPYAMSSPSATACKTNRGAFGDDASGQGEGMGAHEAADVSSKSNDDVKVIRFSVNFMRGCFGGCTFCSITEHEGRIIQSRSENSIIREIESIRDTVPGFTGVISDVGGPTANMYRLRCKSVEIEAACRRLSCVYPDICSNLNTDHAPLVKLYRRARALPGIKKILVASGLRYDLAIRSPEYVKELVQHHVGGYLKIAPEHTEQGPLSKMMKPGMGAYDKFKELFDKYSQEAGKEQYLIPYFIAAHPGTIDEDMLQLALCLIRNGFRADQVQTFLPSPMATATAMYHSGKNPLRKVTRASEEVSIPKGLKVRRLHKAFLRNHDANNWPLLREALKRMGRADLIGNGKHHLVPSWQPAGTGEQHPRARAARPKEPTRKFLTQHTGLPRVPAAPPRKGADAGHVKKKKGR